MRYFAFLAALMVMAAPSLAKPVALPNGSSAYSAFPDAGSNAREYRIGSLDTIGVTVFQEPDLTVKDVQVDSSGNILLPLIGSLHASGKTTAELGREIAQRYDEKYLDDAQVSILVQTSVSQSVTVEGSVTKPGVYQVSGRTTLIDALAMAEGPTQVAKLDEIVVFRDVDDRHLGAVFDLRKIRRGEAEDPEILGRDRIVVGLSHVKSAWRDVLTAAPLLNVFTLMGR